MVRFVSSSVVTTLLLLSSSIQGSEGCVSSLTLLEELENDPSIDTNIVRTYALCPGYTYQMADFNKYNNKFYKSEFNPITDQPPIFVRPNLHIKCGDNGLVEDNCMLQGGEVHVDASTYYSDAADDPKNDTLVVTAPSSSTTAVLSNVVFEGITFSRTNKYMVYGNKPGDITFLNCEFKNNHKAIAPVLLDCFEECQASQGNLKLTFMGCTFFNNRYKGDGAFPALITVNGKHNSLVVTNSFFVSNDMVFNNTMANKSSFLIESSGSSLVLQDNCFIDNKVGVSPIVTYDSSASTADSQLATPGASNYGTNSNGNTCNFHANFQSYDDFLNFSPNCIEYDDTTENSWGLCTGFVEPPSMTIPPTPVPAPLYDVDVLLVDRTQFPVGQVHITHTDRYTDGYLEQTDTGELRFILNNVTVWSNGYVGIQASYYTYYTQIQGDGNILTRRESSDGTTKNVWRSNTDGDSSSYFFLAWAPIHGNLLLFEGKPEKPQILWRVRSLLVSVEELFRPPTIAASVVPSSTPSAPVLCGGGNIGTGVCENIAECCSWMGYCGTSPEHCNPPTPPPTIAPTTTPTKSPTAKPTLQPTASPSSLPPTFSPTIKETASPTNLRTPTMSPTTLPTVSPSISPVLETTSVPTPVPTNILDLTNNMDRDDPNQVNKTNKDTDSSLGLYIGLGVGIGATVILSAAFIVWKRRRRATEKPSDNDNI